MKNEKQKFSKSKGAILSLERIDILRGWLMSKPIGEDFIFKEEELESIKNWINLYKHTISFLQTWDFVDQHTDEKYKPIVEYLDEILLNFISKLKQIPVKLMISKNKC